MTFTGDPIFIINFVLCTIIFVLGCWGYKKKRDIVPLYIGIAFGIFGLTHLLTLLGFRETLTTVYIIVRTLAYLTVIFALYKHLKH